MGVTDAKTEQRPLGLPHFRPVEDDDILGLRRLLHLCRCGVITNEPRRAIPNVLALDQVEVNLRAGNIIIVYGNRRGYGKYGEQQNAGDGDFHIALL
jgi:hypothetical protein